MCVSKNNSDTIPLCDSYSVIRGDSYGVCWLVRQIDKEREKIEREILRLKGDGDIT